MPLKPVRAVEEQLPSPQPRLHSVGLHCANCTHPPTSASRYTRPYGVALLRPFLHAWLRLYTTAGTWSADNISVTGVKFHGHVMLSILACAILAHTRFNTCLGTVRIVVTVS